MDGVPQPLCDESRGPAWKVEIYGTIGTDSAPVVKGYYCMMNRKSGIGVRDGMTFQGCLIPIVEVLY